MDKIKDDVYRILSDMNVEDYIKDYICDYLYYARYLGLIDNNVTNESLLNKFKNIIEAVEIFDEDHEINEVYGCNFKGVPTKLHKDDKKPTLYVRKKLGDKVELYFYHEFTHILQNWAMSDLEDIKYNGTGIEMYGDLLNEAFVQFISEEIYKEKYQLKKEKKEYDSGELRMLPGIKMYSELDNYQHFDYLANYYFDCYGIEKYELSRLSFCIDNKREIEKYFQEKIQDMEMNKIIVDAMKYIYLVDKVVYTNPNIDMSAISGNNAINMSYLGESYTISLNKQMQNYRVLLGHFNKESIKMKNN